MEEYLSIAEALQELNKLDENENLNEASIFKKKSRNVNMADLVPKRFKEVSKLIDYMNNLDKVLLNAGYRVTHDYNNNDRNIKYHPILVDGKPTFSLRGTDSEGYKVYYGDENNLKEVDISLSPEEAVEKYLDFGEKHPEDFEDLMKELNEKLDWLNCPECGSSNTDFIKSNKEFQKFKNFESDEDSDNENVTFKDGTKEEDVGHYHCNDCGCDFTKTDVDIKYSKIKDDDFKNENLNEMLPLFSSETTEYQEPTGMTYEDARDGYNGPIDCYNNICIGDTIEYDGKEYRVLRLRAQHYNYGICLRIEAKLQVLKGDNAGQIIWDDTGYDISILSGAKKINESLNNLNEVVDEDYKTKWDAAKTLNKLNKDTLEQLVDWYSELYKAFLKNGFYKKPNGQPYKSYFFMPADMKQEFVSDLVSSLKAVTKRYQVIVDEEDIKALCRLLLTKEKYLDNVKDVKIKINDNSTKDIVDDDVFENFDK